MAKVSDSKRMYSWWWNSHISPKNSKWLQENLTEMDSNVKVMIKLIEEDADSFARRAEMYYKKRPELMKMVEEFYRAYRALAERYDNATGVIRQAHHTMSKAFPNQVPMMFSDDSPEPRTPGTITPNGEFTDEYDFVARRKGLKQSNDSFGLVERVRKGLNFDEVEEKEQVMQGNENIVVKNRRLSKPDEVCESEEIRILKESLAKLEAEKEAGFAQYQQSLDKLSHLESEISQTKEDFRVSNDRATKAENEVIVLKESLSKLETEKETKLQDYQKSLERLSNLQNILSSTEEDAKKLDERASSAEIEAQYLKGEMDKLVVEKDEALSQYMKSLEMISDLENKLRVTEEDSRMFKERAENAENEVELLKQPISKLTQEKNDLALQYQKCLEMIFVLENKLRISEEESKRLNAEVDNGVSKFKGAEEQCLLLERTNQSLHTELESLMLKMGTQTEELTEKQTELGRLWTCVQEERLRFVEAETAFQTLQHLHAQTQEELRSMASELNKRAQLLKVLETSNENFQDEVLKAKSENEISASSIKNMESEIFGLKESKGTLEEEVELRIDQRNALQQEIYCLKEELNNLNKLKETLGLSMKELRNENSELKETCNRESSEKAALLGKMVILDQLIEKKFVLENSLCDLNAELEAVRGKIEILEQSCQSLLEEKSTLLDEKANLMIQLEETNKNLEKISENNTVLENSLADAQNQFEALNARSKMLEDSCQLLVHEKADLMSEKDGLISDLENTRVRLEDLGKIYGELERRCISLEKEKESSLRKVEELEMSLDQERASYIEVSEKQKIEMNHLQEECQLIKSELDQMMDNSIENEVEIFVLRRTAQQVAEINWSNLNKNEKLLEESSSLEKKISELENNSFDQKLEIKCLSDEASNLRAGIWKIFKGLDIKKDRSCKDKTKQDSVYFNELLSKVQNMKESICIAEEENQQRDVEFSVVIELIRQLQTEVIMALEMNKAFESKLRDENCNNEALLAQVEHLNMKLIDMEGTCHLLEREKLEITEEKRALMDSFLLSKKRNNVLEEENFVLSEEVLVLDNLSLIFRSCTDEKFSELRELGDDFNKLHDINADLSEKLSLIKGQLEESISIAEEENQLRDIEVSIVITLIKELQSEVLSVLEMNKALESKLRDENRNNEALLTQVEHLNMKLIDKEGTCQVLEREKSEISEEKQSLVEKNNVLDKENYVLFDEVLALDNLSLIFRSYTDEKFSELRELGDDFDKLRNINAALMGKLSLTEEKLEESKTKNLNLQERLQKSEDELKDVTTIKDQFCDEIENGKKILHQMEIELHGEQNKRIIQEQNLEFELQKKMNEFNELETEAALVFDRFQYSMVSQLIYEQKFHELNDVCVGYMDENEDLKTQMASYGPEVLALKDCISSLENRTDIHIKFQNPESEEMQDAQATKNLHGSILPENNKAPMPSTFSDFCNLRARLQAIEKAAAEIKESMVQENIDLHSKLDASTRQLELLQSESGRYRRNLGPTSEITEEDNESLKDIVLDQVSDGYSKREPDNQIVEFSKKIIVSPKKSDFQRVKPMKKQKGEFRTSDSLSEIELNVDKIEISKIFTEPFQEGNKRKFLERLDSDVQKLANLQITVQDLKRKLVVTEKDKRGKDVIECEALKNQLEEADVAIMKLFDLNGKLMKNIDYFPEGRSSFDLEKDGNIRRKRVSEQEQARRISEKIGRLQLEVQKLQFVLLKLYDDKERKAKVTEIKRRVLLRDYLYGGVRKVQRRKKTQFCACVRPSTVED